MSLWRWKEKLLCQGGNGRYMFPVKNSMPLALPCCALKKDKVKRLRLSLKFLTQQWQSETLTTTLPQTASKSFLYFNLRYIFLQVPHSCNWNHGVWYRFALYESYISPGDITYFPLFLFLHAGDWDCHSLDPTVWHVSVSKTWQSQSVNVLPLLWIRTVTHIHLHILTCKQTHRIPIWINTIGSKQ